MDAVGMERATIFGLSEGGPAAIFFSVTRRERTNALVLFGSYATGACDPQPDWLRDDERADEAQLARVRRFTEMVLTSWGEGRALNELVPNQGDEAQLGLVERLAASPSMAKATLLSGWELDVSDLLQSVSVPTLIVHARGDWTIGDLVVGSGLAFESRGAHELKGVPGEWELLAVAHPESDDATADSVAELDVASARSGQRPADRLVAAVVRRAPGAVRTAMRADPRYRRSVKGR